MSSDPITPLLDLALDHPHSRGYIAEGDVDYGFDVGFGDPSSTIATQLRGLDGGPHVHYADEWKYEGATEYVPEINGVTLKPSITWKDETLARWSGSGSYWHVTRPSGEQADFVEWYDTANVCPEVTSTFELPQNQPLVLTVIYAASSAELNLRVEFDPENVRGWNYRFDYDQANDLIQWYDVQGADELRKYRPSDWVTKLRAGVGDKLKMQLQFRPLDDWVLVSMDGLPQTLVYYERDVQLPDHKIALSFGGRRVAWNLSYLQYPTTGTNRVSRKEVISVGDPFNAPDTGAYRAHETANASVSDSSVYVAGGVTPRLTLSTSNPNRTPVLYSAYMTSEASLTTPGGLPSTQQLEDYCESLVLDFRRLRGHMATATFNDWDAAHTIHRNSILTVQANHDLGGGETADEQQFVGYAMRRMVRQDGRVYNGQKMWSCRFIDASSKLASKRFLRHPHYGNWTVSAMATRVLKAGGIQPGIISISSAFPTLDGSRDDRLFAYDANVPLDEGLTDMLDSVRWEWGIDFYPTYSVFVRPEPSYASVYASTLDEDTANNDEEIERMTYHSDLDEFANQCWVRERGADGSFGANWSYHEPSVSDDTSIYFTGDWTHQVSGRPDVKDATIYAKKLLAQGKQNVGILEWTWTRSHFTVFPGDYVRVQCPKHVANNSIFLITDLRRTFDMTKLDAQDEVTAVLIQ